MSDTVVFSRSRSLVILLVGALLALLLGWQIVLPVKRIVSDRYRQRGDIYLVGQDFETAEEEYHTALTFNPQNTEAADHLQLAQRAAVDIASARSFYQEHQVSSVLQKLNQATKPYTNPKEALQVGIQFYQQDDFSYAQYPIKRALQLDPQYPEAWHYLGLVYEELAKTDSSYQAKADAAVKEQNSLTPMYLQP